MSLDFLLAKVVGDVGDVETVGVDLQWFCHEFLIFLAYSWSSDWLFLLVLRLNWLHFHPFYLFIFAFAFIFIL
jgi:hypothetical protein